MRSLAVNPLTVHNLLFLLLLSGLSSTTHADYVKPDRVQVSPGDGFIIRLEANGTRPWTHCKLTGPRDGVNLLDLPLDQSHQLASGEVIRRFDSSECGVRVQGVNSASGGHWQLFAADTQEAEFFGSTLVVVTANCDHRLGNCPLPYTVTDAGSTILECRADPDTRIASCDVEHAGHVYELRDGLQMTRYSAYKSDFRRGVCQFEIPNDLQPNEIGTWTMKLEMADRTRESSNRFSFSVGGNQWKSCQFFLRGNATQEQERLHSRTSSTIVLKTTGTRVRIPCADNVNYKIRACYLLRDGELEFARDATQLASGNCGFDVSPGNWTCGFNAAVQEQGDLRQRFEVLHYDRELIDEAVRKQADGSTTMECHWIEQRPLQFCAVVAPSGRVFRPPSDTFSSQEFSFFAGAGRMASGHCGVSLPATEQVESGDWQCVVVREDGEMLSAVIKVGEEKAAENKVEGS